MSLPHPSEAELEILQVLWEIQPATVREVHQILAQTKDVGYTTTLKQIQRMLDKQLVSRNSEGKTHMYSATLQGGEVRGTVLSRLAETAFKGSAMSLAMHALGQSKPSEDDLEALEQWLDAKRKENNA